jgi:PAS domain S-box-containing protein
VGAPIKAQSLRLLIIEDLEPDYLLITRHLTRHGVQATWRRAGGREELVAALADGPWDVALSDYNVPGLPFREGLALLREHQPDLPVILVSGSVGEEEAVELLKTGLSDFVLKDRLTRLVPAIERSLREFSEAQSRRAMARALRGSEERYRLALDAARLGTWWHDTEQDILVFDDRACRYLELETSKTTFASAMARVHPDDAGLLSRLVAAVVAGADGEGNPGIELRVVCREGGERWVSIALRPRHDAGGTRPRFLIGTVQDITDRHEAEAALRDRIDLQDQMARIGSTVPGVVYSFRLRPDGSMSVPFATPAMREVFRIRRADIVDDAAPFFARVHPADLAWMQGSILASARTMTPWRAEFRIVHPDGEEHWIEGHSVPVREADGGTIWHGFAQDVTERKRADERLRASEARWQFALESADQAVWDWNVRSGDVFFSRRWKSMMELADHQVQSRFESWTARVHPDDLPRAMQALHRHFRGDAPIYESEHRMCCAGGTERWVLDRGKVVEWTAESEPQRLIATMTDITQRKRMESALRESETRANLILETVPAAILVVEAGGTVVRANERAYQMFRHAPGSLVGCQVDTLVPEPYRADHGAMRARYMEEGRARAMGMGRELSARRADGSEFAAEISLGVVGFDGVRHAIVTVTDITARKLAEQAVRDSEQTLAQAQAMAKLGSWQAVFEENCLVASDEMRRILCADSHRLTATAVFDLVHPEDLAKVREAWLLAVKGLAPYDVEHRAMIDGQTRWLHAKAIITHGPDGRAVSAVGMTQDITEVREAQLALEAHRQHLETVVAARTAELRLQASYVYALVDNVPFQVWLKDTGGRYLAANRAYASACGLAVTQMIGRDDVELWPGDLGLGRAAEDTEVRSARRSRTGERRSGRDGAEQWVETYNAPVLDEDGNVLGTVGFARDITDRKQNDAAREVALAEARRLARVRSDFLANMSHEIRTPLNAVLGLAQAGARAGPEADAARLFERILDSGALLLGIVDDILDFSKIEAGKFTLERVAFRPGDVVDRALGVVAPRAYAKGLAMRVTEAPGLPEAMDGDPQRMVQVLVNLLANAVKFTERGGVTLGVSGEADGLRFTVVDTGIGMAPAHLERLFQPFEQADGSTTRRFGGTGLGLAICHRLVDMMGGRIRVTSELGKGTTFEVTVPVTGMVPARPPSGLPARAALVGLGDAEAGLLAEALAALDVAVEVTDASPGPADLTILDFERYEACADIPATGRLLVACYPGASVPRAPRDARVTLVERPLRLRHVLAPATPPRDAREVDASGAPRLPGLRVLSAEDNEVNRLVLDTLLGQEGARVVQTANGRLAVERLMADGPGAYDVVLTDIQMPEMDGYEVARRVRSIAPDLPVIGLTAHAMPEERDRCIAAGMVEHLAKPLDLDRLVDAVRRHVRGFRGGVAGDGAPTVPPPPLRRSAARPAAPDVQGGMAPLVDWQALLNRFKGRREFVDKLVVTVLRTHQNTSDRLRAAARGGDLEDIVFVAHSLKGMGGNLMAQPLRNLADHTESTARTGGADSASLAERLAQVLDDTLAALSEGVP